MTWIETESATGSGRRSGCRERRSASGGRRKIVVEGESVRTERRCAGGGRRMSKKTKSVPRRRKGAKTSETLLTLRGRRKTTGRTKVVNENVYEIR